MNQLSPHLAALPCRGAYVAAWKKVLAAPPEACFRKDWHTVLTAAEAKREFSATVDRRVNVRGGESWRNDRTMADTAWLRDSRTLHELLNTRIRHYQFETPECTARFGHLLANRNEL